MSRFSDLDEPQGGIKESSTLFDDWKSLKKERNLFDRAILDWAIRVTPDWFEGDLSWYSGAISREVTKPKSVLAVQMFNHQTHHRG